MIVAGQTQYAAVFRRASGIAVPKHVTAAVDARTLAVPDPNHAIEARADSATCQSCHGQSFCESCHTASDTWTMHKSPAVVLGCTDCHGGDARIVAASGLGRATPRRNFRNRPARLTT